MYLIDREIKTRAHNDARKVIHTLPKDIIGVTIHEKYYIQDPTRHGYLMNNVRIECTLIKDYGITHLPFHLFSATSIIEYVLGSKTNITVSQL